MVIGPSKPPNHPQSKGGPPRSAPHPLRAQCHRGRHRMFRPSSGGRGRPCDVHRGWPSTVGGAIRSGRRQREKRRQRRRRQKSVVVAAVSASSVSFKHSQQIRIRWPDQTQTLQQKGSDGTATGGSCSTSDTRRGGARPKGLSAAARPLARAPRIALQRHSLSAHYQLHSDSNLKIYSKTTVSDHIQ